ncbi:terminase family protein [Olsenella sp. An293]|uniref:terminase large subunit domain-containing protein n=1 Tax=Olsenella sp. An293 TaxID=1965626 RepID=UPI000B38479D|nr:terminase family protein [Olsenella sp. An293]OUO31904.1 hypothetical protein B5F85_08595 [Olsenella sp. An293]
MATRYGRQEPTFEVVGGFSSSRGGEAVGLFESYGVRFMPWQARQLELYLARDGAGRAASKTIGLSVPRQNGKSYAARFYAVWCAAVEGRAVLYTAHHGVTTREMFKRIKSFAEGTPDFAAELAHNGVKQAQGNEAVYFANGGFIEFNTRTTSVSRGKTYDVIVVDEAQTLDDLEASALQPTTLATDSGDPQMIYIGTPPDPKCKGTVFRDLHRKAHAGELGGGWWLEWAATEIGDPHDAGRWYECCPAMGYRIREDVMADAADKTAADSFAREYLGWWGAEVGVLQHVIDRRSWDLCETDEPPEGGLLTVGVKFSPDGTRGALAVCLRPMDERFRATGEPPYVEVIDVRPLSHGVSWFAKWVLDRKDKVAAVAVDGKAGSGVLIQKLVDGGLAKGKIVTPSAGDAATANAMIVDAVRESALTHYGQEQLTESATETVRRKLGKDGFGFEDTEKADATLIEACALAYWQAMTTKRRPGRKAVVY